MDVGHQIQFANALKQIGYQDRATKALKEACQFHQKAKNTEGYIELTERLIAQTGGDLETRLQLAQGV